jgi:tetratricopeptide (TPR) repeat protein
MGDAKKAFEAFQQALKDDPKSMGVRTDFADFEAQRGETISALKILHEAIAIDPKHAGAWRLGGDIALRQPATRDFAADWTGEAVKFLPESKDLRRQHAEALLLTGHPNEALSLWQEAAADGDARSLAASLCCETAAGVRVYANRSFDEVTVSREFLQWYRRLVQFQAEGVVIRINARLPELAAVLPGAAAVIQKVAAEAMAA